jgi:hypothetical protein
MAEPVVAKKKYTYQDYLKTPDGERYELIQGDLVRLTSPYTAHQNFRGVAFQAGRIFKKRTAWVSFFTLHAMSILMKKTCSSRTSFSFRRQGRLL